MEVKNMNCIFCKIINGQIPSYKIYEDDMVYAFLDINPDSAGHTLIIPKKHFQDLSDIDDATLNHIMKIKILLKHSTNVALKMFNLQTKTLFPFQILNTLKEFMLLQ